MPAILCVYAHPDDESFGASGTLAKYARAGVAVYLLCATRGQEGIRPESVADGEALGRLREVELRCAAEAIGMRRVRLLDYQDGAVSQVPLAELVGHVSRELEEVRPDVVLTFGPQGITGHGDHIAVGRAAEEAIVTYERRHGRSVRVYYDALSPETAERLELELSGPEVEITHLIDISETAEAKLRAMACHASQPDAQEYLEYLRSHPHWARVEHFHRASPPAKRGSISNDLFD
jgi:LmbE family N-acetylglucosaminyl deacetylase